MKDNYKVTVKIGDVTVDVQGAERGVVNIVKALSGILGASRKPVSVTAVGATLPTPAPSARSTSVDIRTFFQEKSPSSDVEATAVAAYYYQYIAPAPYRRDTVDATFLQEAFRLAKWPLPSRTNFTLVNARNAGYLDSVGEGQYRLNPVGYNLVEHTIGRPAESTKKPRRRRK